MPSASIAGAARTRRGRRAADVHARSGGERRSQALRDQRAARPLRELSRAHADRHVHAGRSTTRRRARRACAARSSTPRSRSRARATTPRSPHIRSTSRRRARSCAARSPSTADLLATYDERLVATGTQLILERRHYVAALAEVARTVHAAWVGPHAADGELEIRYRPNVPLEAATADAVAAAFEARLRAVREGELQRRQTLAGPHRDDVEIVARRARARGLRLARAAADGRPRAQGRGVPRAGTADGRCADLAARRRPLRTRSGSRRARSCAGSRASSRPS